MLADTCTARSSNVLLHENGGDVSAAEASCIGISRQSQHALDALAAYHRRQSLMHLRSPHLTHFAKSVLTTGWPGTACSTENKDEGSRSWSAEQTESAL